MNTNKTDETGESKASRDNAAAYHDGDSITIEGKRYIIAGLKSGGYTLLNAGGPGWTPADFE